MSFCFRFVSERGRRAKKSAWVEPRVVEEIRGGSALCAPCVVGDPRASRTPRLARDSLLALILCTLYALCACLCTHWIKAKKLGLSHRQDKYAILRLKIKSICKLGWREFVLQLRTYQITWKCSCKPLAFDLYGHILFRSSILGAKNSLVREFSGQMLWFDFLLA